MRVVKSIKGEIWAVQGKHLKKVWSTVIKTLCMRSRWSFGLLLLLSAYGTWRRHIWVCHGWDCSLTFGLQCTSSITNKTKTLSEKKVINWKACRVWKLRQEIVTDVLISTPVIVWTSTVSLSDISSKQRHWPVCSAPLCIIHYSNWIKHNIYRNAATENSAYAHLCVWV